MRAELDLLGVMVLLQESVVAFFVPVLAPTLLEKRRRGKKETLFVATNC